MSPTQIYRPFATNSTSVPSSAIDPPTSLSLSLPGSDSRETSNHGSGSDHIQPSPVQQVVLPAQSNPRCDQVVHETQFFNAEFLAVMQEMIKKEVRNYMSGLEQNGLCMQTMQTEAIRNAVVKSIGISRVE